MSQAEREAYAKGPQAFSGTSCISCQRAEGAQLSRMSRIWKDFIREIGKV